MIKCHECKATISSTAKACPLCGAPPKAGGRRVQALLIVAVLALIMLISQCSKYRSTPQAFDPDATLSGLCMLHIKGQLHDPASAEFEHSRNTRIIRATSGIEVIRSVRAKNAFGAMRLTTYQCTYKQAGTNFTLIDLKQIQ